MNVSLGQSSTPDNTRIYAIGDVHGHITLLEGMLEKIKTDLKSNPVELCKIIFLGDYIDRGPDSAGCVEFLINLMSNNPDVLCLKGNHEDKLEEFLTDPVAVADSFFTYGGADCANSYGVDMSNYRGTYDDILKRHKELKAKIPTHHKQFFSRLSMTETFGDYMFVHAGVRPGIALDQQADDVLMWIRYEFIEHVGLYDKVIVHGHTPTYPMDVQPNRINVDTHAYHTNILSCVVLEGTDYRVIEAR